MVESILNTIKQMLGLPVSDDAFDVDIVVHINSAFMTLGQLGVGPQSVFSINDEEAVWTDFVDGDYAQVKSYVYLFVKMAFDPPSSSSILESIRKQMEQIEWRLSVQVPIE